MNSSENSHSRRARMNRSPSVTRRSSESVSVIASSAVVRVSTSGVFATTIPARARRVEVDVVDADRVVRDDTQAGAGALEVRIVDGRRQQAEDPVGSLRVVDQLEVARAEPRRPRPAHARSRELWAGAWSV